MTGPEPSGVDVEVTVETEPPQLGEADPDEDAEPPTVRQPVRWRSQPPIAPLLGPPGGEPLRVWRGGPRFEPF